MTQISRIFNLSFVSSVPKNNESMKTRILTICFLLLSIIGVRAENVVSLSSASGHPGDEVTLQVGLTTIDAVTAAEIIIPLDKQLTYVEGSATLNNERANGHQLSAAVVDGALRIYVYSISLKPLKGTEGTLATFRLKLKKEPADYSLIPQVVLSDATGKELQVSTQVGCVTLLSPKLIIVNTRIDYGHIPIRSTYTRTLNLQNSGTEPLEVTDVAFSAAEFSVNEKVFTIQPGENKYLTISYAPTMRGAVEETVTITSNAINGEQRATLVADPFSVNELHVVGASGNSDTEVEIALRVNNMEPLVGAQCTFTLPEALEYVEGSFATVERSSSHTATSSFTNGKLTVILYSSSNTTFDGNDGVIGTFRLKLDGKSGTYSLKPESVVLSNIEMENMTSATQGAGVIIQSPTLSSNASLSMGSTAVTTPLTTNYTVRNSGRAPLVIDKVTFLTEGFSLKTELPLTIEKSKSATLEVEYTPTKEGDFSTTMNIYTNDPENRMKAVAVSGTVYEPNSLTLDGENQEDGTYQWTVGLNNYTDIVAVQMDIHWLKEMTTSMETLVKTARLNNHSCSVADMGNGVYRVIVYSMNNATITGNDGALFTLTYTPQEGTTYQNSKVQIKNIVLSNKGGSNYESESSITTDAKFTGFILKFILEGTILSERFVRVGTPITLPEVAEKEGYTFSGWGELPATMPAQDLTFTASYIINKYKLIYLVDSVDYKTTEVEYGSAITAETAPTKEGHTFSGWSEIPATMPAKDITVTGTFTVNSYKVSYILDGETFKTEQVFYGTAIPIPEAPGKEGYTFCGWGEIPETMPADDVRLEGTFSVNSYNLVYMVDGVNFNKTSVEYGSVITALEVPTKEGYTFSGWSEIPETMPAKDVTIEGTFSVNSYDLVYMVDGVEYNKTSVEFASTITALEVPTKEGHTFSGWSEIPETMPAKDVMIEGTFSVNSYNLVYIVDGIEYKKVTLDYASAITAEAEPTKEGHTFSGWSEIPATMPAKDVVITGTFTANKYAVIYTLDGEAFRTDSVAYGTAIVLAEAPAKEGHTFAGWSEVPAAMPANDVTVTGIYTVNQYTLTYMVDGAEYKKVALNYASAITAEAEPTKEGHTFSGWSEIPATMPAKDVTVVGEFTVNMYQITYMVDGEVYATEQIAYGSAIVLKDAPVKEGYIFSGWSEAPEMMPATDVVIEGSFTVDGIDAVITSNLVDVYTLQGVMVKRQIPVETLAQELPGGIYIVNGKKMVIR